MARLCCMIICTKWMLWTHISFATILKPANRSCPTVFENNNSNSDILSHQAAITPARHVDRKASAPASEHAQIWKMFEIRFKASNQISRPAPFDIKPRTCKFHLYPTTNKFKILQGDKRSTFLNVLLLCRRNMWSCFRSCSGLGYSHPDLTLPTTPSPSSPNPLVNLLAYAVAGYAIAYPG